MAVMFKITKEKFFLTSRLVGFSPETPKAAEAPKLKEGLDYTKMTAEQVKQLADLLKGMNADKVKIGGEKGPVNVLNFRTALKAALDKVPGLSELKLKNVDLFLLNGLMQNLGKTDKQNSTAFSANESRALNDMMVKKDVKEFQIVDGYWMFFDKKGEPVKQDYKLDDKDAKDPSKPGELVGTAEVERAVLTGEVKEQKEADAKAKQEEEAKQKAETERTDVKNLETVSSPSAVPLTSTMDVAALSKALSASVTEEGKPARINETEVSKALLDYVDKTVPSPQGVPADQIEAQRFSIFLKQVMANGYDAVAIQNGKLLFSQTPKPAQPGETRAQQAAREKSVVAPTSNPLNAQQKGRGIDAYAHENLIKNAEAQAEEERKSPQQGVDKPTRFDATATEVARRLSGKKEASEVQSQDFDRVDERYLNVMQAILNYKVAPRPDSPVKVDFPFNDGVIPCEFFLTNDGRFVITKDNRKVDVVSYTPRGQGKDALNDMQDHFAQILNKGTLGQELQRANVEYKGNFEQWGEKIDSGPEKVNGGVKYEFDWETGALGDDPDVTFFPQPHGRIEVVVEQNNIGLNGEKEYRFNASGLSDALRVLKKLRSWVENKNGERDSDKAKSAEQERRFFEESDNGNRIQQMKAAARAAGAGDLLSVRSSRNILPDGKGGTMENNLGKFNNGHHFDFDWMQKLDPPQRMQMVHDGRGEYEYYLIPSNQKLGEFKGQPQEALEWGMKLVAEQRNHLARTGGEKATEQIFQNVLEGINKMPVQFASLDRPEDRPEGTFVLCKDVTVKGATAEGIVDLAFPGMKARQFNLGTKDRPNVAEFRKAVAEGYLLLTMVPQPKPEAKTATEAVPGGTAGEKKEEPAKTGPEAPKDSIGVTNESAKEMPDAQKREAALKEVFKKVQGDTDAIKSYVMARVSDGATIPGDDAQKQYQERMWKVLAELTGKEKDFKPEDPASQKIVIDALSKPATRTDIIKIISKEFVSGYGDVQGADKMPRCRSLVASYVNEGRMARIKETVFSELTADQFDKAKQSYISSLKDYLNKVIVTPKKLTENTKQYDERVRKELEQMIKTPEQFFSEYKANEDKRKPYEDYKAKEAQDQAARAAFESRRDQYHGISFAQFEGSTMNRDLGGPALDAIKACKDLKPGNVFMSNLPENSPMSQKEMMFNVSIGPAGNGIPMTLHFTKTDRGVDVSAAPGWNNPNEGRSKMAVGGQKDVLATVLKLASDDVPLMENLQSEQQKADAAKADAAAAKAEAAKPATPEGGKTAAPPANPEAPKATVSLNDAKTPEDAKKAIGAALVESGYQASPNLQKAIAKVIESQNLGKDLKLPAGYVDMKTFVEALQQGKVSKDGQKEFMAKNPSFSAPEAPPATVAASAKPPTAPPEQTPAQAPAPGSQQAQSPQTKK